MTLRFAYLHPNGNVALVLAARRESLAPVIGTPVVAEDGTVIRYNLNDEDYRSHVLSRSIPEGAGDVFEIPAGVEIPDREGRTVEWLRSLEMVNR